MMLKSPEKCSVVTVVLLLRLCSAERDRVLFALMQARGVLF